MRQLLCSLNNGHEARDVQGEVADMLETLRTLVDMTTRKLPPGWMLDPGTVVPP